MNRRKIIFALLLLLPLMAVAQTRIWNGRLDGKNRQNKGKEESIFGLHTSQYDGVHHLVGVYADGAFSTMLTKNPAMTVAPGGYGVGGGFLYAYHNGTIIVQTGLGVRWQQVWDSVHIAPTTLSVMDAWGWQQQLTYTQTQRCDEMQNLYVEVPLMLGTYFAGGFYVIAGPKIQLQLYGKTHVNTVMTTTATYPNHFVGILEQMDNHGLRDGVELATAHDKLKMTFDVAACLELGYEFPLSNKGKRGYRKQEQLDQRIRVGAFAEVGILNQKQTAVAVPAGNTLLEGASLIPNATRYDFQTYDFRHITTAPEASAYALRNIYAGLRLTYFFYGHQSKERCLQCGVRGAEKKWW